jgi:hypothetical protein
MFDRRMVPDQIVVIEAIDQVLIIVQDHDSHGIFRAALRSVTGLLASMRNILAHGAEAGGKDDVGGGQILRHAVQKADAQIGL